MWEGFLFTLINVNAVSLKRYVDLAKNSSKIFRWNCCGNFALYGLALTLIAPKMYERDSVADTHFYNIAYMT